MAATVGTYSGERRTVAMFNSVVRRIGRVPAAMSDGGKRVSTDHSSASA